MGTKINATPTSLSWPIGVEAPCRVDGTVIREHGNWAVERVEGKGSGKYDGFLREVDARGVLVGDTFAQADMKREMLARYFARRFGSEGRQDLGDYRPDQIGKVFRRVVDYAEGAGKE